MQSKLLRRSKLRFLGALTIAVLALTAAGSALADTTTKHVTFVHDVVIGGRKVAAGDYHLVIGDGQLVVEDGNRMVAHAPAKWELRDDQADHNSVLYADNYSVAEIRFAHQREVLVVVAP
jgi:hypothetical protein